MIFISQENGTIDKTIIYCTHTHTNRLQASFIQVINHKKLQYFIYFILCFRYRNANFRLYIYSFLPFKPFIANLLLFIQFFSVGLSPSYLNWPFVPIQLFSWQYEKTTQQQYSFISYHIIMKIIHLCWYSDRFGYPDTNKKVKKKKFSYLGREYLIFLFVF